MFISITTPENMGLDTSFIFLDEIVSEIHAKTEFLVMADQICIFKNRYLLDFIKNMLIDIPDPENIGLETLFVVLCQILAEKIAIIGFWVMADLICIF